jgi:23S rRNA pseudouridine2604 synthase
MCNAFNYQVIKLQRVRVMHIELNNLNQGQWRDLTEAEIEPLLKLIKVEKPKTELEKNDKVTLRKFEGFDTGNRKEKRSTKTKKSAGSFINKGIAEVENKKLNLSIEPLRKKKHEILAEKKAPWKKMNTGKSLAKKMAAKRK